MNVRHFLPIVIILLANCKSNQFTEDTKVLDYKYFTIRVPKSWKRIDVRGIDSYVGALQIDSKTQISFDMGWYCDTLGEGRRTTYYSIEGKNVYVPDSSVKQNLNSPNACKYWGPADSGTIEKLRHNQIGYTIIDHYRAKLVTPKRVGLGTTGIYIDSLWKAGDYPDGFVLSGDNLTLKQQQQVLVAIKTLKFYEHPDK